MIVSSYRLRRGDDRPVPPPVVLVAGDLRAELDGCDLRSVTWGGTEVLQRLYMAVRDAPWNTVPGELSDRTVYQSPSEFRVTWRQRHRDEQIDVAWEGLVHGTVDGSLVYEMTATAGRPFRHSKIGLNMHHAPAAYLGRCYRAQTRAGIVKGVFPELIAPQLIENGSLTAMFDYFDELTVDLDDCQATFTFEGDQFEMQDHRNWSDANYKTYGTPLSFGFPRDAAAGDTFWQRITLRLDGGPAAHDPDPTLRLTPEPSPLALPAIGHRATELAPSAQPLLRRVRPDYLRVEIAAASDAALRLAEVRRVTGGTTPLEVVFLLPPDDPEGAARQVVAALASDAEDVARVIILASSEGFSEFKGATAPALGQAVMAALSAQGLKPQVFSGTNQFFNELNRNRPDYAGLAGVTFALNPQVHAADDRSLMQNTGALPYMAASCRALYPHSEISVGPVHLVGPSGPFPAGLPAQGQPPAGLDARHWSLFGAAWTVGMLEAAVRAGVDHITLHDLVGPRGLALLDPLQCPAWLTKPAGSAFPVLWPFSLLRRLPPGSTTLLAAQRSDECALLGLQSGERTLLVLSNLRQQLTPVALSVSALRAQVAVLDETTCERFDPDAGQEPEVAVLPVAAGELFLTLRPYSTVAIEVDHAERPPPTT